MTAVMAKRNKALVDGLFGLTLAAAAIDAALVERTYTPLMTEEPGARMSAVA